MMHFAMLAGALPSVLLRVLFCALLCAPAHAASHCDLEWSPFAGEGPGGTKLSGEISRILVPENRSRPSGSKIEIEFVRFPCTGENPGPPIYYLIGGPGVTATRHAAAEALTPSLGLLEYGDFIAINQRGTGNSVFNEDGAPSFPFELPLDKPATRASRLAAQKKSMAECAAYWVDRGVDLSAYNSVESADDIEAVRQALGHGKIVLWGTSYGSHLSLSYLRRHQKHVARAVLMKVEGPDQTFKLPSATDEQLDLLQELIDKDTVLAPKMPNLKGSLGRLMVELGNEPLVVTLEPPGRDPIQVSLGPHDLETMVAMHLGFTGTLGRLPAIVHSLEQGDWRMLAMASINLRRGGIESPMAMMMDASSGASKARLVQIREERRSRKYVLGDAMNFNQYPEASTACGSPDVGKVFRGPLPCHVPVLFVSGDLDARTPPANVEGIIGAFENAAHVIVQGTGHDSRELTSPKYCGLVKSFLGGESVESQVVQLAPIEFTPIR